MNFGLLRIDHNWDKVAVAGTVKGEKIKGIGSTAEHALTGAVCRMGFIGYFINFFLATQKRLDFLNALSISSSHHF